VDTTPHLRQYLPRLVRYWDAEAPGHLHRSIEGSMVFVDISGFTKMSERLARHGNVGAEEVTEVIDNTFGTLLPEAYGFGANLLKFGGDALLLMFTDEGHTERAAAGAYAMRAKLREIGTFQTTAGKVSLRMSVGAHSGDFDFFLVGESHREFIVAGPAATRTVEMEGAANANQILISTEMAARLDRQLLGDAAGPGVLLRHPPGVEPSEIAPDSGPTDHLAQFIPTALREVLGEQRVEPEHRPTAVAFLHYEGFDRLLAERGGPETGAILHRLVGAVQAAADDHDVTFLATDIAPDGGKIILTAGVPHTRGNDEERMLLSLRRIVTTAPAELPLQIGVNWGPVFSGSVGPFYRRTFTVMGDVVNLAARLMSKASEGEVYATEEVLNASRTIFSFTKPEPFFVKGKSAAIQAYSVGDPAGSRDGSVGEDLPLIGRESELEALVEAWDSVRHSHGQVIEIAAEVGMGKSRLLQEFFAQADAPRIVATECRLYQAATPYFPFRALLRDLWDLNETDEGANLERLQKLVDGSAPHLEPWISLLAAPLDLHIEESPQAAQLEDQFRPARILATVSALLEATVEEPTIFVIEDNHWMDDASAELLEGLIQHSEHDPWMFILTRRPGEQGFVAAGLPHVSRFDLGPLTLEDAHRFIVNATRDDPLLPRQVELLAERAEGRPLFLLEMLDAVRRGGDVEALPHSVEGLIGARIDRLPPQDRNLLRRLAVLGAGFRLEYTDAVLREREQEHRKASLRRLDEFLFRDKTGWIQFRNALIRDVAYEGLPFKTRLELHARIGDSILAAAGDDPESEAALLSLHYFQARHWPEAWRYSRAAGDAAKSVYANQTAATFYRRALTASRHVDLEPSDRADIAKLMGDVLEQAGLYDDALDAYKRAMTLIDGDPAERAELLLKRAQVKMRRAAYAQALRDAAVGLRLLDEDDPNCAIGLRSRLLALRSTVRMAQQRPLDALALAEEAAACARTADEKAALARAYAIMDWAYFMTGRPERAGNSPEAVEIYESLGHLDKAADVLNNMGGFAYYMGDWNASIGWISKSREMSIRAGNDVQAAMAGVNLGELLVSQGKLAEAHPILEDSHRVLKAAGDQDNAVNAELQLARLLAERGEATSARHMLEVVLRDAQELGQTQFAYEAALYLAECRIRDGEPDEALDQISAATARAGEEAEFFEPKRARIAAQALVRLGKIEDAESELLAGLEAALELGLQYDEVLIRLARNELAQSRGKTADRENLQIANRLLDRLGIEQAAAVLQGLWPSGTSSLP
jgi:class 3 adenylate cyclase/Tfp pilus assembly protein PilF